MNLETAEKTYLKGSGVMCPRDGFVVFQNSTLMCGRLGKVTLGGGNKSGLFQAPPFTFSCISTRATPVTLGIVLIQLKKPQRELRMKKAIHILQDE